MAVTLAERFFARFRALDKAHGRYVITGVKPGTVKITGKARTVLEAPTVQHWQDHLDGKAGIGLVPITADNTCCWGAIDVDKYDIDLEELSNIIDEQELPVILFRTKSGGAHLYIFTSEPVPARLMREKLILIERSLGYKGNEIFPKQETLRKEDTGNWINMPYFEGWPTQRYALHGAKGIKPEAFLKLAAKLEMTKEELTAYAPKGSATVGGEFDGAPPCLLYFIEHGFPQGSMNNALFSMGVFARKKFPEKWQEKVDEYNKKFMGPGTYNEVQAIIKSLGKKGYQYKCKDQPIAEQCQKNKCIDCTFGIPDPKVEKENRPCVLDDADRPVTIYLPPMNSSDEPYYEIKLSGRTFDLTVDEIMDQGKFIRKYFITFRKLLLRVTEIRWARAISDLDLENAVEKHMAPDAGPEGQLMNLLEQFCTGKVQARNRDELILGKPWTDDGRTYFCSKDLYKYLAQQQFRAFKEKEMYAIFRRHGADHHRLMLKGKCVGAWSVPSFTTQTEEFDRPIIEEDEKPF